MIISWNKHFIERKCVFCGPDLVIVSLNIFSLFGQEPLRFIMKVHSNAYPLKITFRHQQGKQINVCVWLHLHNILATSISQWGQLSCQTDSVSTGSILIFTRANYFQLKGHFLPPEWDLMIPYEERKAVYLHDWDAIQLPLYSHPVNIFMLNQKT